MLKVPSRNPIKWYEEVLSLQLRLCSDLLNVLAFPPPCLVVMFSRFGCVERTQETLQYCDKYRDILRVRRDILQVRRDFPRCFVDFFSFFHLTYSRWTSSLPSCLWSQRIFPSLPGSRLTFFLSRCKFSTLTTRQPMVEFYLLTTCVCACVVIPSILDVRLVDVPAVYS